MRTKLRVLLPILLSAALVHQVTAMPEDPFLSGSVKVSGQDFPYRLLAPTEIVEGTRYPLVLFLHGAGERGSDNQAQLRHFPERMVEEEYRKRFPCFLLAPQCPSNSDWAPSARGLAQGGPTSEGPTEPMQAAIKALGEVLRDNPIDPDRVYLTGLSMGGGGTWDLAVRHPDWFAAAVPICGGGDATGADRLAGLPLSVWHGSDDTLVVPGRSQEMVDAIKAVGGNVRYTELPGVGHGSWVKAYDLDQAVDWMFKQRRDSNDDLDIAIAQLAAVMNQGERVAFLGDSITQAGNNPGGYVDTIRKGLNKTKPDLKVIPAGISGHKVPDLLSRYQKDVIEPGATLVFIYIGINDVWHSDWDKGTPPEEFESGLHQLIRDFRKSGAEVVLATPSVIGEKPHGENRLDKMLDEFAEISRRVAREEGITLCDLQLAFEDHLYFFNPTGMEKGVLTSDEVHLNDVGNQLLAIEAARSLTRAARVRSN
jgi:lysophospholipase L1-like esterase/poly(3-hydroxybutyrate) depolymerase